MEPDPLLRRGRILQYVSLVYNVVESALALLFGAAAGSTALLGFGIDSAIESISSITSLWRLGRPLGDHPDAERLASRIIGLSFFALALYVSIDAVLRLVGRERPDASISGIILAAMSVALMPSLALAKRRVARGLGSGALLADMRQTALCAWLSVILLAGIGLHAWLGWWWADPAAAICMVPIIAREGVLAYQGRHCCVPFPPPTEAP